MAKSSSKSSAEPVVECTTEDSEQLEQLVQDTANQVTKRQYILAKALLKTAKEKHYSEDLLIENICILMASSFREGINLALKTYGLAPDGLAPDNTQASVTAIPVHAVDDGTPN